MATALAGIQYLPQIWMTWHLGHVGSLSIPMMLIQTPGSFVWSGSLAVRLGIEGWSTWGVFLVTGCLQGCLLVMGICFEVKARWTTQGQAVSHPKHKYQKKTVLTSNSQMQDVSLGILRQIERSWRPMMRALRMWKIVWVRGLHL